MKILITGGAGFIGTNLAEYLTKKNDTITILDNFSRKGTRLNSNYLATHYPKIKIVDGDIRNYNEVKRYVKKNEIIFHLAGQVAVTTSLKNPREDFESNILGTFNILEAARKAGHKPLIIESSTNKVYGEIAGKIQKKGNRYFDICHPLGISEKEQLDFHSPYGCSKGAADQYVRDYYRIFDIPTVVFRQSCIYGPHQFGVEDQGWVAHLVICALFQRPMIIYGTGYQTRDILYIDDLIRAYQDAIDAHKMVKGEIFNIGGGSKQAISLIQLIELLEEKLQKKILLNFAKKRPGDQDVFISNNAKITRKLHWKPKIQIEEGITKLIAWIQENSHLLKHFA